MLIQIFKSVLLMSAVGGALSAFLLCAKPVTRKLFSPKWQYYIWLTVLIVMVLPVSFSLPKNTPDIPDIMTEQVQNVQTDIEMPTDNQNTITEIQTQSKKFSVPKINLPQNIWEYLSAVWLFAAAVIMLAGITKYYLFLRTIRKHSSKDTSLAGIPKRLEVRRTDMLDAPLIIGLIKPVLYLPDTELTESDLSYILMHELTHYRRHDLLYKWIALIIKSVHWFNPFIYLVSKQIDLDCEVSCDFAVTSNLTQDEQNNYMNMILGLLADSGSQLRPLTTQMASNKKTLKRRFEMIRNKKKTSKFVSALSAVFAVVMLSTTVFASGVLADLTTDDYTIEITNNGEKIELVNKPFIENGEVYVPLRELCEKVGVLDYEGSSIEWNDGAFSLSVTPGAVMSMLSYGYDMKIGENKVKERILNELPDEIEPSTNIMSSAPILKGSVTYVPYEYIDYMINYKYGYWDIDYNIFSKDGADKNAEVIKRKVRRLTSHESKKLVPDYENEEGICYDVISDFASEFESGRTESMKQYCTEGFISTAFDGDVFKVMPSGKMQSIYSIYLWSDGDYRVTYSLYKEGISEDKYVFVAVMKKQPDGRFLIDELATGL